MDDFESELRHRVSATPAAELVSKFESKLKNLGNYIPDEAPLFKAAYSELGKMNDGDLSGSYQSLIDYVDTQQQQFNEAANRSLSRDVKARQDRIAEIRKSISGMESQIAILTTEGDNLTGQISTMQSAIESKRQAFAKAVSNVKGELRGNSAKVQKYLGGK